MTCDPKDDYLIAYALVGRADYLVAVKAGQLACAVLSALIGV